MCMSERPARAECAGGRTPAAGRGSLRRAALLLAVLSALALGTGWVTDSRAADAAAAGRWLPAGSAPGLGTPLPADEAQDRRLIFGDGQGLPAGQGSAAAGAPLYQAQCAGCHGVHGEGRTAPELIGGEGPLSSPDADKTLKTYWPYAPTLFDTIRRSMPPQAPGQLSAEQIYALCAWLLAENGLWPAGRPLDAAGLAGLRMPNRDGFLPSVRP